MKPTTLALLVVLGACARNEPHDRVTPPPAPAPPAPTPALAIDAPPALALAPTEHVLAGDELSLGTARVGLAGGKVELVLVGSDQPTTRLLAVDAAGTRVLWTSEESPGGMYGLFVAGDKAILVRGVVLYDQDIPALQARRFRWDAAHETLVADGAFDGEPGALGPAWIPAAIKDRLRAQLAIGLAEEDLIADESDYESDPWWTEPPWLGFDGWTQTATWTAPTGETLRLAIDEDNLGASLLARGEHGETVLVGDGDGGGFDVSAALATMDDVVAFHLDHTGDGEGTSTLYVLQWDAAADRLMVVRKRIGDVHRP
jgi:hypothetical protein